MCEYWILHELYSLTVVCDRYNAIVLTEGVNISCTPPEVRITPSQTVTMMDESTSREIYATMPVWVVLSLVGLLLFLAIVVVVGIILFLVHKKTKKPKLAEFVRSRLATLFAL